MAEEKHYRLGMALTAIPMGFYNVFKASVGLYDKGFEDYVKMKEEIVKARTIKAQEKKK